MKNIHVLPTQNNITKLAVYHYDSSKNIKIGELGLQLNNEIGWSNCWSPRELYIISDEEIKEGFKGWFIGQGGFHKKCISTETINNELYLVDYLGNTDRLIWCKKIILTTDQELIKDGVQPIDDKFLEWFIKNHSCENVEVEKVEIYKSTTYDQPDRFVGYEYKIIIPKEEPKQDFPMQKLIDIMENDEELKPKQETLEEAAEKYADIHMEKFDIVSNDKLPYFHNDRNKIEEAFEEGARWQQERSYSEEELNNIIQQLRLKLKSGVLKWQDDFEFDLDEWFEQLKKK